MTRRAFDENTLVIPATAQEMKTILLFLLIVAAASSGLAQAPAAGNSTYPTRLENLLRQTGMVITSSSQWVGTEEGRTPMSASNNLAIVVRTEAASDAEHRTKAYGLALQMRETRNWRSQTVYVDYDELDGLIAGINKLLVLQPEVQVVQAKYETRGGLMAASYTTEKREVLAWLEINNDDSSRVQISLDALRDFRDLIVTARKNLDLLRTTP
jgi:hypothetical protein